MYEINYDWLIPITDIYVKGQPVHLCSIRESELFDNHFEIMYMESDWPADLRQHHSRSIKVKYVDKSKVIDMLLDADECKVTWLMSNDERIEFKTIRF